MRIRITSAAGWYDVRNDALHRLSDVIELADERALKLIRNRIGEAFPDAPRIETAAVEPPRNATRRTKAPRPRKAVK